MVYLAFGQYPGLLPNGCHHWLHRLQPHEHVRPDFDYVNLLWNAGGANERVRLCKILAQVQ